MFNNIDQVKIAANDEDYSTNYEHKIAQNPFAKTE